MAGIDELEPWQDRDNDRLLEPTPPFEGFDVTRGISGEFTTEPIDFFFDEAGGADGLGAWVLEDLTTATRLLEIEIGGSALVGHGASVGDSDAAAIGDDAAADGVDAVAVGAGADAEDDRAIAVGPGASAAFESMGIGIAADGGSFQAMAIGLGATTAAGSAVALGRNANAQQPSSVALGRGATTRSGAVEGIAIGNVADVVDDFGIAIGRLATAHAQGDVAVGQNSDADNAVAIGSGYTADGGGVGIGANGLDGGIGIGRDVGGLDTDPGVAAIGADQFVHSAVLETIADADLLLNEVAAEIDELRESLQWRLKDSTGAVNRQNLVAMTYADPRV